MNNATQDDLRIQEDLSIQKNLLTQEDMRVQRTKEAIRATFKQMMCEMDYGDITIKELAERARINRKTFYLHFSKLEDLLIEIREAIIKDFLKRIKTYKLPKDLAIYIREFFTHQEELGILGERIICIESNRYTLDRMSKAVARKTSEFALGYDDSTMIKQSIMLNFASQGILGVFRQWISSGKTIPLEEIIELTITLVCSGTDGFLTSNQSY